jgi:hypothetical protein
MNDSVGMWQRTMLVLLGRSMVVSQILLRRC